jgi:hypothetical protein
MPGKGKGFERMKSIGCLVRFLRIRGKHDLPAEAAVSVFAEECSDEEKGAGLDWIFSGKGGIEEFLALADLHRRDAALRQELNALKMESADVARLKRFAAEEMRAARNIIRTSGNPHKGRFLRPATAAAAVLAVILTAVLIQKTASVEDIDRDSHPASFEALAPRGEILRSAIEFNWSPVRGAKHYCLEILDRELAPLYRKDMIEGESFTLPGEVRDKLTPGQLYFWKVTADLEGGGRLESGIEKFRISGT